MEKNNCPKPDCGRPESTHRFTAGKRMSICGNGHSWNPEDVQRQKAIREAAQKEESSTLGRMQGQIDQLNRDMWGPTGKRVTQLSPIRS